MCGNSCITFLFSLRLLFSCWISSKTSLLYIIHGPICAALLVSLFLFQSLLDLNDRFVSHLLFLLHNKKINLRLASSEWALRGVAQKGFNCVCFVKLIHLVLGGSTRRSPGPCCLLGIHLISATRGNWSLNSAKVWFQDKLLWWFVCVSATSTHFLKRITWQERRAVETNNFIKLIWYLTKHGISLNPQN